MKIENSNNENLLVSDTNFSSVGPDDFSRLIKEYNKKTIVLHSDNMNDYLESIRKNFKDDYFVQIGFVASASDILNLGSNKGAKIFQKNYFSKEEAFNDIKITYDLESKNDWYHYIPKSIHVENLSFLKNELNISRVLTLEDSSNELIASIMTFDSQLYTGENLDQIGWVWIKNHLSEDVKASVHYKISKWLQEYSRKNLYQAGIHIENIRSQKFFQKMGFIAICAHITKR